MTDRRRYHDMSDEEFEGLVASLPRRVPSPALRKRILSRAPSRPRSPAVFRPAFALAALALLIIADLLALRVQDASLAPTTRAPVVTVNTQAAAQDDQDVAWLREIVGPHTALIVALRPASGGHQETYFQLRTRLLAGNNGG